MTDQPDREKALRIATDYTTAAEAASGERQALADEILALVREIVLEAMRATCNSCRDDDTEEHRIYGCYARGIRERYAALLSEEGKS